MLDYLDSIRSDGAAFAAIIRTAPLDTDVPSCPGWKLRDLAWHMGHIHRWARLAAATAKPPNDADIDPAPTGADGQRESDALAGWLVDGVDGLTTTLASIGDDDPTWHPFPVPRRAGVWPRRQAHELAIHRWDAESAVGATSPLDPALAADFVREYFEVIVPRVIDRDAREAPTGRLGISLTDTGDRFTVASAARTLALAETDDPDDEALLEGTAGDVLLALWRRRPLADSPHDGLAAQWLDFGGN